MRSVPLTKPLVHSFRREFAKHLKSAMIPEANWEDVLSPDDGESFRNQDLTSGTYR